MKRINVLKLSYLTAILSCVAALATSTYTKDAEGCSGGNGAWLGVDVPDVAPMNGVLTLRVTYSEMTEASIANSGPIVTLTKATTEEIVTGQLVHHSEVVTPTSLEVSPEYVWVFIPDSVLEPSTPYNYTVTFTDTHWPFDEMATQGSFTTSTEQLTAQKVNATMMGIRLQGVKASDSWNTCSDGFQCTYTHVPDKETFVPKMMIEVPALGDEFFSQVDFKITPAGNASAITVDGALAASGFVQPVLLDPTVVDGEQCVSLTLVLRQTGEESEVSTLCGTASACPEMDSIIVEGLRDHCEVLNDEAALAAWCFFHSDGSKCEGVNAVDPTPKCPNSQPTGGSGGSSNGDGGSANNGGSGGGNPQVRPVSATQPDSSEGCSMAPQLGPSWGWMSWLAVLAPLALKKRRDGKLTHRKLV